MKKVITMVAMVAAASVATADLSVNFSNQNAAITSGGAYVAAGSLMQLVWSANGITTTSGGSYAVGAGSALAGEYILDSQLTSNGFGFYGPNTGVYTSADVGGADINSGSFFLRAFETATGDAGSAFADLSATDASSWVYNAVDTGTIFQGNLTGVAPGQAVDIASANTTVVPEPATIGLMGIAGLGLFASRKKIQG